MPEVFISGVTGIGLNHLARLKENVIKAISDNLPCKQKAVMVRMLSEIGTDAEEERYVVATLITFFFNDKPDAAVVAGKVKAAVEKAIYDSLPGIKFAECFPVAGLPFVRPSKELEEQKPGWQAVTRGDME